jgi:glucuronoarabinoxylan endo-1,4-beta-xylanase
LSPPVHLIAAEPVLWSDVWAGEEYGSAIVGDSTVSSLVDIIATHDYDHPTAISGKRPSPPAGVRQHIWQTEVYYSSGAGISAGLDVAKGIYAAVTSGGVSAWHYWWTQAFMDGGSASSPPKRVYTMGNFSKFVRPGYVRVAGSGAPSGVYVVPFVNPADGALAIVALNSSATAQQASFFLSGSGGLAKVTPYVTSSISDLAAGTAISVSGGRFSASLDGSSVTTFVAK